jgi:hypothetical protein
MAQERTPRGAAPTSAGQILDDPVARDAANNPEANVISIPAEIKRLTTLKTGPLLAHAGRNDMGRPIYKLTPAGEEADIM